MEQIITSTEWDLHSPTMPLMLVLLLLLLLLMVLVVVEITLMLLYTLRATKYVVCGCDVPAVPHYIINCSIKHVCRETFIFLNMTYVTLRVCV